jgi:hypothetical protein
VSFSRHLKTETDAVSETSCFLAGLESRTMGEAHKPSDSNFIYCFGKQVCAVFPIFSLFSTSFFHLFIYFPICFFQFHRESHFCSVIPCCSYSITRLVYCLPCRTQPQVRDSVSLSKGRQEALRFTVSPPPQMLTQDP